MKKILVTGASGQIGSALTAELRERYGPDNIVAAAHVTRPCGAAGEGGPCVSLDVRDGDSVRAAVHEHGVDTIYHLAALLSATAEKNPALAWDVNMKGLMNVLDAAAACGCAVFFPSSIGAFGPTTPRDNTPQDTIQRPSTMYGITKLAGELLCDYYFSRFGVDSRGLRYPGLISYEALPGGGTTDYAVEVFHAALTTGSYTCFLEKGTRLDMMYMPDAVRAAVELMEAELPSGAHRNGYNVTAFALSPEELVTEIRRHVDSLSVEYKVDPVRQAIAESWPRHMDDSAAREEWGWQHRYDLPEMTTDMLQNLRGRLRIDGGGSLPGL